jgi:GTP diphosphokinase / guanosine-3',5'-bis(diphosphate) 3'-diphosphatase
MSRQLHEITPTAALLAYKEVLRKYRTLYQLARPMLSQGDGQKLQKAFRFVLAADQKSQYWAMGVQASRSLDVAKIIISEIGLGVTSTICALLYKSSADIGPSGIKKIFGAQVAQTVHRITKLEAIPQFRKLKRTKNPEILIAALTQDPKVVLIKMAENLQEMRTLADFPCVQRPDIASQAKFIYVPIAHRLGFNVIKAELEDLYLKFTNAIAYHTLTGQIQNTSNARERFIERFTKPIQEALKKRGLSPTIKTRIKSLTSIQNKMKALGLPFEQVYDVFAIRIILNVPEGNAKLSCWKAYEVVTNLYKVHPNKFRNWLSYPRSNGYQSLHATVMSYEGVWVEVQIRTQRMDEMAEKGHAAHWRYKETSTMEHVPGLDTWLNQIRTLLEQESQDGDALLETINASPKIRRIEVLTDQGQSIFLPVGATVLDFAFELGTSCGLRCIGAQVNNKLVACHYALNHSDQVKVITAGKQQILEEWLDFTVTHKVHGIVKKFLRQKRNKKIARGKKLVREKLCQLHLEWNAEVMQQLLVLFDEEKIEDLFFKAGEGSVVLQQFENFPKLLPYKVQAHRPSRATLRLFMNDCNVPKAVVPCHR